MDDQIILNSYSEGKSENNKVVILSKLTSSSNDCSYSLFLLVTTQYPSEGILLPVSSFILQNRNI